MATWGWLDGPWAHTAESFWVIEPFAGMLQLWLLLLLMLKVVCLLELLHLLSLLVKFRGAQGCHSAISSLVETWIVCGQLLIILRLDESIHGLMGGLDKVLLVAERAWSLTTIAKLAHVWHLRFEEHVGARRLLTLCRSGWHGHQLILLVLKRSWGD